jgi:hypothetical protein
MKKLISLIASGLILFGGNAVAQENNLDSQKKVFANLGITERFAGYENYQLKRQLVEMGGVLYELKDYDTNGDRKKDVRETFDLFGKNPSIPFSYMFDLNFDGEFSDDEIWMDDYEDGLNGNEKRCDLEILNANGEKI